MGAVDVGRSQICRGLDASTADASGLASDKPACTVCLNVLQLRGQNRPTGLTQKHLYLYIAGVLRARIFRPHAGFSFHAFPAHFDESAAPWMPVRCYRSNSYPDASGFTPGSLEADRKRPGADRDPVRPSDTGLDLAASGARSGAQRHSAGARGK